MQLSSYHQAVSADRRWQKRTLSSSYFVPEVTSHRFLFVGTNRENTDSFVCFFAGGAYSSDLAKAEHYLDKADRDSRPDVIFIDVPLKKQELSRFISFLKKKDAFSKSVVIYNEEKLDKDGIQFLKTGDLVDDVLPINNIGLNFFDKVAFLKRLKNRQYVVKMDRNPKSEFSFRYHGESFLKRVIDIVFSLAAIIVLAPVFIIVGLAIRLESKGSVIYKSRRAGRGFKIFQFYKFRTMEMNADQKIGQFAHMNQYGKDGSANFLKISNDPRITRIGKFLRNSSLDELPQLFNVLKGDMSLVGNRPLPLYEASTLTTNEFAERFMAPAGITGLWQIKKRGMEEMSSEERINLDISYARRNNLAYDLWIMIHTPKALLQKSNV